MLQSSDTERKMRYASFCVFCDGSLTVTAAARSFGLVRAEWVRVRTLSGEQ